MRNTLRLAVMGLIVLGVVAFMTTYTVRFTEQAVVTTFGRADEDSVRREAGLYFKWPYPAQSVTRYDTRVRLLEGRPETQQTADNKQLVVTVFLTYRVSDPLKFYKAFGKDGARPETHFAAAEKILQGRLRSATAAVGQFRMSELFNLDASKDSADAGAGGLAALEARILTQLGGTAAGLVTSGQESMDALASYGVEPVAVGVSSVRLPEDTTKAVFERMKQTRDRLAQEAVSRGSAESGRIQSEAQADVQKILAFAERRAKALRGQGDQEAAQYLARQSADPELAVFLQNLEFMRQALGKKVTLVLPTSMPGINFFAPDALKRLGMDGGLGRAPAATIDSRSIAPAGGAAGERPSGGPSGSGGDR